jgi:hypothetical protein
MPTTPANPRQISDCIFCGEPMWMTEASYQTYKRNGGTFYCLHGHGQVFAKGKSEAEKLREQLDEERRRRQRAEQQIEYEAQIRRQETERADRERNRANGYKGHATRITKRAKAGVCPCCNRTFKQLAAHMANKHPEFTPMVLEDRPREGATVQ